MKKQRIIIFVILVSIFCCGCSKSGKTANTKTYVMPVELYMLTDLDTLDDSDKSVFNQQVVLNLQASEHDGSLTSGQYDDKSGLISLTFNDDQKNNYISSLIYFLKSDSATMYSNGEYKLLQYSDDSKIIKIETLDKEAFEKYQTSFDMSVDILIQLQILMGATYDDAMVKAEITYNNGTYEELTLTWKDIY